MNVSVTSNDTKVGYPIGLFRSDGAVYTVTLSNVQFTPAAAAKPCIYSGIETYIVRVVNGQGCNCSMTKVYHPDWGNTMNQTC